jgi:hypothetical protein
MHRRIASRAFAAVAILALTIVAAGFAFLHLPAFEETRRWIAANLLSPYLGEAVVVKGGVDVTFGPTIDVAAQGVLPVADAAGAPAPVGKVRMSFATDAALRGRLDLTALKLTSVRLIIDAAASGPSEETLGERVSRAVEGFLSSPRVRSLELDDLRILRINDPAGWNGSLIFDTASSRETDQAGGVSVEARGSLNGQAFTLSGELPGLSRTSGAARDDAMSLSLAFQEIEADLDGLLTQDATGMTLAARQARDRVSEAKDREVRRSSVPRRRPGGGHVGARRGRPELHGDARPTRRNKGPIAFRPDTALHQGARLEHGRRIRNRRRCG